MERFLSSGVYRFAALIISVIILVQPVSAADIIDVREMRNLAYAGDVVALETALDDLQAAVAAGEVSYDDQRNVYGGFLTSDPRMHEFIDNWLAQMPGSVHSRTAKVWIDNQLGWNLRGERYMSETHPLAFQGMKELHRSASDLAWEIFNEDAGFIPAADAILRLEPTVRTNVELFEIVQRTMALAPNMGTLDRAVRLGEPRWGGSFDRVRNICAAFAEKIEIPENYTSELCMLRAVFYNKYDTETEDWAWRILEAEGNQSLDYMRRLDPSIIDWESPDAGDQARAYLDDQGATDFRVAYEYDQRIGSHTTLPPYGPHVEARAIVEAENSLEHDPYNPATLKFLIGRAIGHGGLNTAEGQQMLEKLIQAKIMGSPYNGKNWAEYGMLVSFQASPHDFSRPDPFYGNAIAYSNHLPRHIRELLGHKSTRLNAFLQAREQGITEISGEEVDFPAMTKAMVCPAIRLHRLWEQSCQNRNGDFSCKADRTAEAAIAQLYELAAASDICEYEQSADLEELIYEPVDVTWIDWSE